MSDPEICHLLLSHLPAFIKHLVVFPERTKAVRDAVNDAVSDAVRLVVSSLFAFSPRYISPLASATEISTALVFVRTVSSSSTTRTGQRKKALLVGIRNTSTANNRYPELYDSHNDVHTMRELLIDVYHYVSSEITILVYDGIAGQVQPTRANIMHATGQLVKDTRDGDHFSSTSSEHSTDAVGRYQLAVAFAKRYQRSRSLQDLGAALENSQAAVEQTPSGHGNLPERLETLAVLLTVRYQILGDSRDLEAALQNNQEAVAQTPEGHSDLAERLHSLAASFWERYQISDNVHDLAAALENNQAAVEKTPEGHPYFVERLQTLASLFRTQYQRFGDLLCLEAALRNNQEALGSILHRSIPTLWPRHLRGTQTVLNISKAWQLLSQIDIRDTVTCTILNLHSSMIRQPWNRYLRVTRTVLDVSRA
ncbi:hypothetical protein B0H13DRAFT_2355205 [Mycena leptocephala]|nr:hypothetical protein B0H13DRAFT_2355205 [Mycena leptocephala]